MWLRVLAVLAVAAAAGLAAGGSRVAPTEAVSAEQRSAGPRFSPQLAAGDQAWILASIAAARPEAQVLIAEIDGTVEFGPTQGPMVGVANLSPQGTSIDLNLGELNGRRVVDRESTVLHELGHVIDYLLIDEALRARLDAGIPRTGTCLTGAGAPVGACTEPAERFADTFAKWALRGRVSEVGAGYGVASPPSLEEWGAPLAALAAAQ